MGAIVGGKQCPRSRAPPCGRLVEDPVAVFFFLCVFESGNKNGNKRRGFRVESVSFVGSGQSRFSPGIRRVRPGGRGETGFSGFFGGSF